MSAGPEIPVDNKCSRCTGTICCTYITEALDTPRSKTDFEHLLWQVSHQGVEIYKDDSGWYLLFQGRCEHILDNGACAIYEDRPPICREYDNDWCEFDEPAEKGFTYYFRNYQELLKYCKKRFKRWGS
ncbi:MAG: YkgJ family cysteine cluster protein [Chromatiales bacterium]|jgi:Fe-S-cluster containining protein